MEPKQFSSPSRNTGYHWSRRTDSNPQPTHYRCVALPIVLRRHIEALRSANHKSFPNSYTTFQSICSSGRSFVSRRPRTTGLSRYHHIDNLASTVNSDFQQDGNQPHLCFLHYLTSGFIARMCPYYLHSQLTIGGG